MSAALAYIKREWHVFPLHTPLPNGQCDCRKPACENVGKHPRTRNGLKDATVDEAIIRGWWHGWPTANIAIACGPSRLVALDV
ncbi:MAG TPA: bifunctional DNA primase/polymerase, partial [Anaerolineales bacterium]|nr:bifunctional DNA primase/polymerase [Anaerolineales bacterium]